MTQAASSPNRLDPTGPGASGFSLRYWEENYDQPETMDGIYNARRRAETLKAVFDAEYIDIDSLVDFGFGLGYQLHALLDVFKPHTAVGIDPSPHAFNSVSREGLTSIETMDLYLLQTDLLSWCRQPEPEYALPIDLGICTSVLQYLSDSELAEALPLLAQHVRYLYLAVPTDVEYRLIKEEVNFADRYAIVRTREEYLDLIRPHFTIVSNRILESRVHFSEETSFFSDLLFRF